jgi:anthraniloyl-CoA monooxygenase
MFGRMYQVPWADMIRNEAGIATMCVGNITTADQANTILAAGRADLVAFARLHLTEPSFAQRAAAAYGVQDVPCPVQYAYGKDALLRNTSREMAELMELKRKARPKSHGRTQPRRAEAAE